MICFCRKTSFQKIEQIIDDIKKLNADALIVSLPESVCWLLNVRGDDVLHTPFVLARGILTKAGQFSWYVGAKRTQDIEKHLPDNIVIKEASDFWCDLEGLKGNVICDPNDTSYRLDQVLKI